MRYVIGNGKTAISMGSLKELDIPYIQFENLENKNEIGKDLLNSKEISTNPTMIVIKNLEGLAVLEKMIKEVKKQLKQE
jgi:hypothetical protein